MIILLVYLLLFMLPLLMAMLEEVSNPLLCLLALLLHMTQGVERTLFVISVLLYKMLLSMIKDIDTVPVCNLFLCSEKDTRLLADDSDCLL
jgi:hypothetical protein